MPHPPPPPSSPPGTAPPSSPSAASAMPRPPPTPAPPCAAALAACSAAAAAAAACSAAAAAASTGAPPRGAVLGSPKFVLEVSTSGRASSARASHSRTVPSNAHDSSTCGAWGWNTTPVTLAEWPSSTDTGRPRGAVRRRTSCGRGRGGCACERL
eukprot:350090-Chlamydomonas_euryale.AAC.1